MTTYEPGDGAAAGDYTVLVTKGTAITAAEGGHDPENPEAYGPGGHGGAQAASDSGLPEKYSRADLSPLTATVNAGENPPMELELQP